MNKRKLIRNWHRKKINIAASIGILVLIGVSILAVQTEGNVTYNVDSTATTSDTSLLGTFYYPWTGGNPQISSTSTWRFWKDNNHNPPRTWESNYLPDVYLTGTWDITKKQLAYMKKAGIQFVISSWWGNGTYTDQSLDFTFSRVLPLASNLYPAIKFTIYYEKDAYRNVPKSEIIKDINYIKTKYATSPYYLKINGKPVVFVYNTAWSDVRNATGIYLDLKVFSGYQNSGYQNVAYLADSWHQYAPLF